MVNRVEAMLEEALAKPVTTVRQRWREKLVAQGRSEFTIGQYMRVLDMYLGTASEHPTFSTERVNQFLYRKLKRGVSSTSLRMYYYALKTLFEDFDEPWFKKGQPSPVSSKKARPKLTEEEMDVIEAYAKTRGAKSFRTRNYALFRVSHMLGLRRIELHRMNISHVHLDHGHPEMEIAGPHIEVQTAKHGRFVVREIDPETARALKQWIYLRTRRRVPIGKRQYYGGTMEDPEPLWIGGVNGKRIHMNSILDLYLQIRTEAGVQKHRAGFHAARRGRITGYHERGATPSQITQEMGWEDERTVLGYIQPDVGTTKIKIREANPRFSQASKLLVKENNEAAVQDIEEKPKQVFVPVQRNTVQHLPPKEPTSPPPSAPFPTSSVPQQGKVITHFPRRDFTESSPPVEASAQPSQGGPEDDGNQPDRTNDLFSQLFYLRKNKTPQEENRSTSVPAPAHASAPPKRVSLRRAPPPQEDNIQPPPPAKIEPKPEPKPPPPTQEPPAPTSPSLEDLFNRLFNLKTVKKS